MRILLLGDSIRMGYQTYVRASLKEDSVDYPSDNGRFGAWFLYNIPHMQKELGNKKYDIIHFNFGLWDVVRLDNESDHCFTSPEEYSSNLIRIVQRLHDRFEDAYLILATTTCVVDDCQVFLNGEKEYFIGTRCNADIQKYNDIAIRTLKEMMIDIEIDDLYACSRLLDDNRPDGTHFSEFGYRNLSHNVVNSILETKGKITRYSNIVSRCTSDD